MGIWQSISSSANTPQMRVDRSHDATMVAAAATTDCTLSLYSFPCNEKRASPQVLSGHGHIIQDVKFSYDSQFLVSLSMDHVIMVWQRQHTR